MTHVGVPAASGCWDLLDSTWLRNGLYSRQNSWSTTRFDSTHLVPVLASGEVVESLPVPSEEEDFVRYALGRGALQLLDGFAEIVPSFWGGVDEAERAVELLGGCALCRWKNGKKR